MATIERCPEHSGFESRVETLEKSDVKQWETIDRIMNRPPAYVSIVYAILTFLLGATMTYASMAVKIAEMTKKP
jgi:hypothetical protein